ncbi:DNA polymerase III subunit gamma/tau [Candidatus Gromoviella agglomerans]|uniref:DNA polymerase III subunit gamma/tau n=1 Tax=Candidatus Gromoviella agglomerans TaxID=2806609 RepID=UPI001E4B104A|nr:DNA polymerase III subunit gamma/tau [Candidatus Gromoviella agglomerans]UFX98604.1 DNA polymerase III subunit gamma/tau N-terminal domain protein [Candidatus Gromoviella agglomerans]
MSSLFLKYRPDCIEKVVGQNIVIEIIKNGIRSKMLPSAFIFSGIRGTGKTTLARILARAFNCLNVNGQTLPCNQCKACLDKSSVDIIEIDAASNTGVDDVRKIIDSSYYSPTHLTYKVFIIDEVHMLSKSAFNALLKIIEEPPIHVKFIFATTELNKVPSTIISRCMDFELEIIKPNDMLIHLKEICSLEGKKVSEDALKIICKRSEGSMRDALSMLEQIILSTTSDTIDTSNINQVFLIDYALVMGIFRCILEGDMQNLLQIFDETKERFSPIQVIHDLLDIMSYAVKAKADDSKIGSYETPHEWSKDYDQLLQKYKLDDLLRIWSMLLSGEKDIKTASDATSAFEIILIRILYLESNSISFKDNKSVFF